MIMVLELGGRNARAYLPEHITRAFSHTNCLPVDKSQERCSSSQTSSQSCTLAVFFLPSFFSFLLKTLL